MSVEEKPASEQPDYTLADVSNHDSKDDLWVAIHEKVRADLPIPSTTGTQIFIFAEDFRIPFSQSWDKLLISFLTMLPLGL